MTDLDMRSSGFSKLVDALDQARSQPAGPIPTPADQSFAEVAKAYRASDPNLQQEVRQLIPIDYGPALLALGDTAAQWALDTRDASHLEDALTAHCLEDFRLDPRDNLLHLSFLWRVAELIDAKPEALFNAVTAHSSDKAATTFRDFASRPIAAKSRGAMGLDEHHRDGKVSFTPRPPPWEKKKT